jgi:hypothetical protein
MLKGEKKLNACDRIEGDTNTAEQMDHAELKRN